MPPAVVFSLAATPELPFAPTPTGKLGCVPLPTVLFHALLTWER
jgi:hypothetical protein